MCSICLPAKTYIYRMSRDSAIPLSPGNKHQLRKCTPIPSSPLSCRAPTHGGITAAKSQLAGSSSATLQSMALPADTPHSEPAPHPVHKLRGSKRLWHYKLAPQLPGVLQAVRGYCYTVDSSTGVGRWHVDIRSAVHAVAMELPGDKVRPHPGPPQLAGP